MPSAHTSNVPSPLQILSSAVEQEPEGMPAYLDALVDRHDIDWETYSPALRREEWGRIMRSPIKSKGHATLDLCVPSGVLTRSVLSRGNMLQVPSLYTAMRKTTWGGLFPALLEEEERSPLAIKSAGAVSRVQHHGHIRGARGAAAGELDVDFDADFDLGDEGAGDGLDEAGPGSVFGGERFAGRGSRGRPEPGGRHAKGQSALGARAPPSTSSAANAAAADQLQRLQAQFERERAGASAEEGRKVGRRRSSRLAVGLGRVRRARKDGAAGDEDAT